MPCILVRSSKPSVHTGAKNRKKSFETENRKLKFDGLSFLFSGGFSTVFENGSRLVFVDIGDIDNGRDFFLEISPSESQKNFCNI